MLREISAVTKNIKVSDKLAERLAKHGGFHTSYADIIESLLDFYEKQRPGARVTDETRRK
jgi:hypothetical protein